MLRASASADRKVKVRDAAPGQAAKSIEPIALFDSL
jgi:hypothetical protein